jgi:hypothetical protein
MYATQVLIDDDMQAWDLTPAVELKTPKGVIKSISGTGVPLSSVTNRGYPRLRALASSGDSAQDEAASDAEHSKGKGMVVACSLINGDKNYIAVISPGGNESFFCLEYKDDMRPETRQWREFANRNYYWITLTKEDIKTIGLPSTRKGRVIARSKKMEDQLYGINFFEFMAIIEADLKYG